MNERDARRLVRERSNGICECCSAARAVNFHHRKARSAGGRWCPSNALDVCGSGTTGDHGWITEHPALAREKGWIVWSHEDPRDVPVLHALYGWVLLDDEGCFTLVERPAA